MKIYDVAIVGFGPVGALLANLLGRAGHRVLVLERDAGVHPLPRAVHFDGEVMRIFQAADLAEAVVGLARPSAKGMRFINGDGELLMERRGVDGVGPQGWPNNWYFNQPTLDATLRTGAARYPAVDIRLQHDVIALTERGDNVDLDVDRESFSARYVVGCDGARSLVRRHIGATQDDLGLHQPWLVVDLLVDPGSPRVAALPDYTIQLCDPARPMTVVNVGGRRRRWEIMLMPGDRAEAMTDPVLFWPMLSRWLGPDDATVERAAVYTFHSVIAGGWRRGRLMLAGDSCHQTPPFLGQGMCAGMRDAANLAWKLDAILRGHASDTVLDTYESERAPHVRAFIALAVRLGAIIQATDPAVAEARDEQFRDGGTELFDFPQPQLGPGARIDADPPVGVIFPQPRLPDGRLLDEAIGARFAVIGRRAVLAAASASTTERWRAAGLAIIEGGGPVIDAWLAAHECAALILRPDRYVFGIARTGADLDAQTSALPY